MKKGVRPFLCSLFMVFTSLANANPWQDLARTDLNFIYDVIQKDHPGPVDPENPDFKNWMENGKTKTEALIQHVNSLEGYRFALQHYVEGFNDGHLTFWSNYDYDDNMWPGFIVGLRASKFIVHEGGKKPATGDEVLSCDGKKIPQLMQENVYPFEGQPRPESRNYHLVPLLLVDRGNPFAHLPKECKFKTAAGKTYSVKLEWTGIARNKLDDKIKAAAFGPRPEFQWREFAPHRYWINFPSFSPTDEQQKTMEEFIAKIGQVKNEAQTFVIDVRGNSGGASEWGKRIFTALYGSKAQELANHKVYDPVYIEWRVSDRNISHVEKWPEDFAKKYGRGSDMVGWAKELVAKFKAARKKNLVLYREEKDKKPLAVPGEIPVDFKGKVYFLTDGRCGSACLDFSDYMLSVPQTIHVGGETAADTTYMEGNIINPLPSQIGALFYPMKVWRARARGNGQSYKPKYEWNQDLGDTPALEKWISSI